MPRNFHPLASNFACVGQVVGQMTKRRKMELAAALIFSPFDPNSLAPYWVNSKCKNRTFNAEKPPKTAVFQRNLVRVTGFEPAASCSQSRRATNCATPGYLVFSKPPRVFPNVARYQLRYIRLFSFFSSYHSRGENQRFFCL